MSYKRPTPQELLERIQTEFDISLPNSDARLRRTVEAVLARILVIASHDLNGFLEYISEQILVDTADAEYLERHSSIWGITRKSATKAIGTVDFVGADTIVIPAGTILQRSDNVQYVTDGDVTIVTGVGSGTVTALIAGSEGNTNVNTKLNIISPISGIQNEVTVATGGLTGGTDKETDDALRARIIARIQQPPNGGSKDDYIKWAKEVAGVTRVWVYPEQLGSGTVSVTFVMDDAVSIIPTTSDVTAVQNYIDGDTKKPVTADVTVFAPTPINIDFNITINPNTVAVQTAIKAEIEDLFKREASPGGTLYLSRIQEAISIASGEFDHTLNSPSANTVMNYGEMPIVGNFTWS